MSFDNSPVEIVSDTPAARALDAKLVTTADLLRLKVIARLHARGLPPDVGWSDLLQEAFTRALEGSRNQPEGVPVVAFLAGVMRSIKEQYWRQARRGAKHLPKLLADLEVTESREDELADPTPSPERCIAATQEMDSINQLFQDDLQARQIISGLWEGLAPQEICATHGMTKIEYDSTRRRIRRGLVRADLRNRP